MITRESVLGSILLRLFSLSLSFYLVYTRRPLTGVVVVVVCPSENCLFLVPSYTAEKERRE